MRNTLMKPGDAGLSEMILSPPHGNQAFQKTPMAL